MTTLDLRSLKLRPGEAYVETLEVDLEPLTLAGAEYRFEPGRARAEVSINRTLQGTLFGIAFRVGVEGPCFRCLEAARVELSVSTREYHEPGGGEGLTMPYLEDQRLDLSSWARDVVVGELPEQILCRTDCLGLCGGCGVDLNDAACVCPPPEPDPRLAVLAELRDRLG